MIKEHLWDWVIFLFCFGAVIYTMIVVREEKSSYLDSAKKFRFHKFEFLIPSWWSINQEISTEQNVIFHRADTHYEWFAQFKWIEHYDKNEEIADQFTKIISELHIELDPDTSYSQNPGVLSSHPLIQNKEIEVMRIEGTGTLEQIERIYFDGFLMRNLKDKDCLFLQSRSSVLNGMLEGPYFEEALKRIQKI